MSLDMDNIKPTNLLKHAVMALILDNQNRCLLIQRHRDDSAGGYWCPVAGGIEVDESQFDAVIREAREEVGIEVRPLMKIGEMLSLSKEVLLHWWKAELISGEAYIAAPNELEDLRWVTKEELSELSPVFTADIEFIRNHMP